MAKLIYVADDELNIREVILGFLNKEGFEAQGFETGDDLLCAFTEKPCDMVILDIMMPGRSGLEICEELRKTHNVPIIIVSARDSELDRITGIIQGSDDYITKPFSPVELIVRVQSIFRRIDFENSRQENETLNFKDIELNINMHTASCNNEDIQLTPIEFELLLYLFKNNKRAVSREELITNVWNYEQYVGTRAVDDTLKRLRKKIAHTNVKITTIWGFGFKLEG